MTSPKMRRGRPKKYEDETISYTLYLPSRLKELLRDISSRYWRSMSEIVIDALILYLQEYPKKVKEKKTEDMTYLGLRLPRELMELLKEVKRESGRSIAEIMREAIQEYCEAYYGVIQYAKGKTEKVRE